MSDAFGTWDTDLLPEDRPRRTADPSSTPLSWEALVALACGLVVAFVLAVDAAVLGKTKHVICDRWAARGQADCGGGDGFREWAPKVTRQGLILVAAELVLLPLLAYGI